MNTIHEWHEHRIKLDCLCIGLIPRSLNTTVFLCVQLSVSTSLIPCKPLFIQDEIMWREEMTSLTQFQRHHKTSESPSTNTMGMILKYLMEHFCCWLVK